MASAAARPPGILGDLLCDDLNDACCWGCSGGGDVVCCDGCRAVYHLPCIGLKEIPEDDWFCPLCHCRECGQSSRTHDCVGHIATKFVPVYSKPLQPRQSPQQRLPTGPGYLCPQQVRQWLQQQQLPDASGSSAQPAAANDAGDHTADEPHAKRQKADPGSSSGSVSPGGSPSGLVRCCCCQQACHVTCLPAALRKQYLASQQAPAPRPANTSKASKAKGKHPQQQQEEPPQQLLEPYFCSPSCQQVADHLAQRCAQGLVQVDALADGTPVCWQLIHPAAVAAALLPPPEAAAAAVAASFAGSPVKSPPKADLTPGKKRGSKSAAAAAVSDSAASTVAPAAVGLLGTGVAPAYTKPQAAVLAQVLRDVQELMQQQLGPAWEVRTFQNALQWMISGLRCNTPGGLLDLSHFHVAVLWVGSTLSAAALVRLHGTAILEVSLAATLEQLQHRQLGRLLISCVERFALETCKVKQAWMPALGGVVKPCVGVSVLPSWDRPAGVREVLQLSPTCSLKLLGLKVDDQVAGGAADNGQQQQQQAADAQQQQPKDLKSCWALVLRYGPAPSVVDWLQLPKHLLLRYSYVPFVTKRLSPEMLVPLPKFRKQEQRAGPASAGGPASGAAAAGAGGAGARAPNHEAGGAAGAGGPTAGDGRQVSGHEKQQQSQHRASTNALQGPAQVHYCCPHPQQVAVNDPWVTSQPTPQQYALPGVAVAGHLQIWQQPQVMGMNPQPQLHQLPPRQKQQHVLQEQVQQQQQLVKQQLNNAARPPLANAGHTGVFAVDARIAAGIAAYGGSASVVSGVNRQ